MIIDAQVHAYERTDAALEYGIPGPEELTGAQMVAALDEVGVDRAICVSPWFAYRDDTTYAERVYLDHPDRFRLVAPVDPNGAGVAERVARWAATPGAVALRIVVIADNPFEAGDPSVGVIVDGATAAGMPVNVLCFGRIPMMHELAESFPDANFVLDHLGITQKMCPPAPERPFDGLPEVLALARYPNVALKLTGACTLSHRPFPFDDLWEPVGRLIDTFGVDRCIWGTDWTRTTEFVTYDEAVRSFRDHWPLSDGDKDALMCTNAERIYNWSRYE